jgi:feruloyl esterase
MSVRLIISVIAFLAVFMPASLQAQSCESLSKLISPTVSITMAKSTAAGTFTPRDGAAAIQDLPSFCRVAANLKPTSDSDIRIEVWLPSSNWNGKFLAVGSGGWGGSLNYDDMADALRRGYATSSTDDGHSSSGASFIVGHPEKFIDFAYRAEHEMTVEARP